MSHLAANRFAVNPFLCITPIHHVTKGYSTTNGVAIILLANRFVAMVLRFWPVKWVGFAVMRTGVLVHVNNGDVFTGRHEFRRCLEGDRYTRLVTVDKLTVADAVKLSKPSEFSKTVKCPGCYQVRQTWLADPHSSRTTPPPCAAQGCANADGARCGVCAPVPRGANRTQHREGDNVQRTIRASNKGRQYFLSGYFFL